MSKRRVSDFVALASCNSVRINLEICDGGRCASCTLRASVALLQSRLRGFRESSARRGVRGVKKIGSRNLPDVKVPAGRTGRRGV